MMRRVTCGIERKTIAILKVLNDSAQPLGSRIISRRIKEQGVDLSEKAVRRSAAID
jgi:repressor of nif and glnA expression